MAPGLAAVLLAAGESTRMGQLKALLSWDGRPLLVYQVEQLLASPVERLAVVLGHRAGELQGRLPTTDERLLIVQNEQYHTGKVSSIVAGLAALPVGRHQLLLGVDQPRPATLISQVVQAHVAAGSLITVAGHGGRRGHPVLFAPELRDELLAIDESTQGLRAVLQRHRTRVNVCETGSPLALVNVNTPEEYEAARRVVNEERDMAHHQD